MKSPHILLFSAFLLEIYYCSPITTTGYTSIISKPKEVKIAYSCVRIVEDEEKSEEKPPVILIHGIGMFKEIWMGFSQILALKTGRKVCVVDLRNHGDSPWSDEYNVASMASDLNPLLQTLKTEKAILLGHSLGGKVAVHFTLNNPNKVEKLIVEDMRPNGVTEAANQMVVGLIKVLRGAIESVPKGATIKEARAVAYEYLKKALGKGFQMDEILKNHLPIKCSNEKCEWKMNLKLFEKLSNVDPARVLSQSSGLFDKPALFIYGELSPFKIFEAQEEIEKLFPKANIVGVKGAGHTVNKFAEYRELVIQFINQKV